MIRVVDILMALLPVILVVIALLLVCALRIVRRGAASSPSLSAVADDPFFYPFGEMPTVPRERHLVACDFRAWGIPSRFVASMSSSSMPPIIADCDARRRMVPIELLSAGALRRNESGGRPASHSGTAVVLTFPSRRA